MRYLYSFLLYLLLPFLFLRLLWKSRKLPAYRERLRERLGFYPFRLEGCIWVHAVSMGEVLASIPLIKALKAAYPVTPLLVTTMTPTGAQQVKQRLGNEAVHAYLPYDFPDAVNRFFNAMNPKVAVMMETELWPNIVAACAAKSIPVCLLNARLSEKSARGYQRISVLVRPMLQQLCMIAVHAKADAERFMALGAAREKVRVTGSIKYDITIPAELSEKSNGLRAQLGKDRFIWVAASTHEVEEDIILASHKLLLEKVPNALLILVPRHPERFDAIAAQCEKLFVTQRRSVSYSEAIRDAIQIYLGDTMGELLLFYGASDVAFVGGSLITRGGHNLLEPAALSKPVLSGPHVFNFAEISEQLTAGEALVTVSDAATLSSQLIYLAAHPEQRAALGKAARRVVDENRGALLRQLAVVCDMLSG